MSISRTNHVAVLLSNRYVFVAGGNAGDRNADIYDTNSNGTNGFTRLTGNPMVNGRTSASASLLTSGKVVIVGGSGSGSSSQSAELFTFNPGTVSGTSVATGTGLTNAHVGHAAILLNGGGVLIAGGSASGLVEVYDPTADSFGTSFSLSMARAGATFGFPLLLGGRAVIGGGTVAASAADYIVP